MTDTPTPDLTARVDALIYHMGECSTIDDVDRQTVIDMRDALVMVCQREAAMIARYDAKLEAAEAERDAALEQVAEGKMHVAEMVTAFEEHVALPDKSCSCHIAPPCSDCVENDYARETLANAHAFLAALKKGGE